MPALDFTRHDLVTLAPFWAALTLGVYLLARAIHQRHRRWWTSPLLTTWAGCFAVALGLHATYHDYLRGTHWLISMLGPATVAFALPIHEHRAMIRRHWAILAIGVVAGSLIAVVSSWFLATWFSLPADLRLSLLSRSITTPFAIAVAQDIGGVPELAATCVAITGICGAAVGDVLMKWLPIQSSFARGALFGMGAHGAGVAKAREVGTEEGSIAGLVMVLAGLANVTVAPILMALFR